MLAFGFLATVAASAFPPADTVDSMLFFEKQQIAKSVFQQTLYTYAISFSTHAGRNSVLTI